MWVIKTIKSVSNIAIQRTTFQKKNMKVEVSSNPLPLENDLTYDDYENRQHSPKVNGRLSNLFPNRTKRIAAL